MLGLALHVWLPVCFEHAAAPTCLLPSLFSLRSHNSQVWFQAVEPSPATGLLPPPTEAEFPVAIRALHLGADCVLLLGEGGRVFVQEPPRVAAGRPGGALAGGGEVAAVELQ